MDVDSDYARFLALYLYESYASTLDARRIFAYGYSNGGFLAQRVACDHADLFAGVWTQAASIVGAFGDSPDMSANAYCDPSGPIHVVNEHAFGDTLVAYGGGEGELTAVWLPDWCGVDLPDGYDGSIVGALSTFAAWASFNCEDDDLPPGGDAADATAWDAYVSLRSGGEEVDWVEKFILETGEDDEGEDEDEDEDVLVDDAAGAPDTTRVPAANCVEGGSATLLIVDNGGGRDMGHDIYHGLRYLDAIANFTRDRAKPATFALAEDLGSGGGDFLATGWCASCGSDEDCPSQYDCVEGETARRSLKFGLYEATGRCEPRA